MSADVPMPLPGALVRWREREDRVHLQLEALFRAHHRSVLALCRHLTGNAAEAEDALQETFLAVRAALPGFRGEAKVTTWIHRIALRVALKTVARRPRPTEVEDGGRVDPSEAHARRDALQRAMAALPAEQRAVISLFAVDGLTHAEIGDILGVPLGTVWSRLHTARRKLTDALRDFAP